MQHLYRHFDKDGTLLYVGVSLSAIQRLSQHRDSAHWFKDIATVRMEPFESREAALSAERKAILEEGPRYNIQKHPVMPSLADVSRAALVRHVAFKPMYSPQEASTVLGVSEQKVKELIAGNKIGHICIAEKSTVRGVRRVFRITGWQLIEFIEHLEHAKRMP